MHAVCITTPYPGTKIWDWCQERGLIPESFSWSHFNQNDLKVTASDKLSTREIRKLYLETFGVRKVSLSRVIKRGLWHPLESASWVLQHPIVAARILLGMEKH